MKESKKTKEIIYDKKRGFFHNAKEFLKLNSIYYLTFLTAVITFGVLDKNILIALFTFIVAHFWSHYTHTLAHSFPLFKYFHEIHHNPAISKKWYAIILETMVNLFGSGGTPLIAFNVFLKLFTGYEIFNNYVLLLTALVYTSVHMINYHVMDIPTHAHHHKDSTKNYGPDIMDMMFGTKLDKDIIENMNHVSINIIIFTALILLTKNTMFDVIIIFKTIVNYVFKNILEIEPRSFFKELINSN